MDEIENPIEMTTANRGTDRHRNRFNGHSDPEPMKVIVVDDDKDVLEVVAAIFECIGCNVKKASGGNEALLSILGEQFDLLVTDYDMPDLNGYQLAIAVKDDSPMTGVLIMTGFAQSDVATELNSGLADGWLFKPFGIDAVQELLGNINHKKGGRFLQYGQ
ncbi:MAG: response regulator [Desulfobacterales bacterium]